jgi:tetratricopeptide (TPR) repeat protein
VRYVLEGSVRRSGNQVRVNAQLIEAVTNTHLWAERFDQDIGDLFALQNEITSRIANTLGWELIGAETARPTDRPDALDYLLRGRAALGGGGARGNIEEAVNLFEHALALDPRSVEAQSHLANALVNRAAPKDPAAAAADLQRAEELIAQALAASPGDPYAHRVKGKLLRFERRCENAISEFEIALATDRNDPLALLDLSTCKFLTGGSDQEAIALTEQAIRLSPRDPNMWWWYTWIGFIHLLQSRTDEAIAWLEKGRSAQPRAPPPHWFLAAAYGFKGERELARAELAEALRLAGSNRYSSVARIRANGDLYTPALRDRVGDGVLSRYPRRRTAGRMTTTHRLAAILSVDIAGYSRLKGRFRRNLSLHRAFGEGRVSTHSGLPVLVASSRSYRSAAEVAGREHDDYPTRWCFPQVSHGRRGRPRAGVHRIWVPAPGSYGRNDAADAGIAAALLSKAVGRPVRVQGMRYEGYGWDPKGPASIHRARVALDKNGAVIGYVFKSKGFRASTSTPTRATPSTASPAS